MARPRNEVKKAAQIARREMYDTPEKLMIAVQEYFDECEDKGDFPDYDGMLVYLGLFEEDVEEYKAKDMKYDDIFRLAMLKRKSYLARMMSLDGKRATGCMNLLKQPENGGMSDKPKQQDKSLKIIVTGLKGGMDSFK